jgi:hypothetical protein
MAGKTTYDRQLRSIGQSLESQRITLFELRCQGDRFVVRGDPDKESSLLATLRRWQRRMRNDGRNATLIYTAQDIEELERQGSAKRSHANRLPDFYGLPNTMRTVGAYLDLKGSQLLELHKHQLSITLLSHNQAGHPEIEERTVASFYDLFVRLHARRGKPGSG